LADGLVNIFPHRSQSPALNVTEVTFAAVPEVIETALALSTFELISSPTSPVGAATTEAVIPGKDPRAAMDGLDAPLAITYPVPDKNAARELFTEA
jgi:hypothetical protein